MTNEVHYLPQEIAIKNCLSCYKFHWQPLTLPHQSKWTQNVSTLLREYFATFDHHHHGQPTHHPSVRLEILKHLTSAGGLLENTMNVREWHNDLLAVLIPVVSEIAMGERAKRGEASGERSRNYLTNITLFHSNSRLR